MNLQAYDYLDEILLPDAEALGYVPGADAGDALRDVLHREEGIIAVKEAEENWDYL